MYKLIRSILFCMDPEYVHSKTIALGKLMAGSKYAGWLDRFYNFEDEMLHTTVCGIDFKNPVGLAAGFDKNGDLTDFLPHLGFGYAEIGSVTAKYCSGNHKPRLFRLPEDRALINRMGLNNDGADAVSKKLADKEFSIPLGVNIAKTPRDQIRDY